MQFCFLISLIFAAAFAEEQNKVPPQTQQPRQQPLVRRKTTSLVRGLTDKIDSLFGTERTDENRTYSTLRLSAGHTIIDGGPNKTTSGVRLMLRPATFENWSRQMDLWLKRKKDRIRGSNQNNEDIAEEIESVGGVTAVDEANPWRPAFEHRFMLDQNNPYEGRMKITKDFEWQNTMNHFTFDVRWSWQRQWESALSTITSYSLSDCLLFQFNNSFAWQIIGRTLQSNHGPVLAYLISPSKAISVAYTTVLGYDPWLVTSNTISAVYRQHIYEDWIDFSVQPFQTYARIRNFEAETGIIFNAEVVF